MRSNLIDDDPANLWACYIQLTEVEQAFKELKNDLSIRPIHHQIDQRIEAHIFVAFFSLLSPSYVETANAGACARTYSTSGARKIFFLTNG